CFPHVVNIAVKTGLKCILRALQDDLEYLEALQKDVVCKTRGVVTTMCVSSHRREGLSETIKQGNKDAAWGQDAKTEDEPLQLRDVKLLQDVDTRWSSIFLMIDRYLELHQAIERYLHDHTDVDTHALEEKELQVLADILTFLQIPHCVQEIVSAEKTPTLTIVLPLYEKLITVLNALKVHKLPKLSHAISGCVQKLEEYLNLSRRTKMYSLAMSKFYSMTRELLLDSKLSSFC
ncbi:hypothetical protein PLICRDRAFT_110575, partial [Plicaturopsis crispa FD-325 SS-3]